MKKGLLFNSLLFYSTLAALFISVSGFLSSRETGAFTLQLIFLPVTVFLVTKSIKTIKEGSSSPNEAPTDKKKVFVRLIISLVIYLCLFAFAYGGITARESKEIGEEVGEETSPGTSPGLIFTRDQEEVGEEQ